MLNKIVESIIATVIVIVLVSSHLFALWANILLIVVLIGGLIVWWSRSS